ITWEIVKENPSVKWDYDSLSANPNITWEIVKENPSVPWNYWCLSANLFNKHPIVRKKVISRIIPLLEPYVNYGVDRIIANYL
ncbi:MAG: hypothetical protein ACP5N7_00475, partial [Candidatus Pacearchaeota archaeon]